MSEATIEQRLSKLEEQLSAILVRLDDLPRQKDWRRAVGMFQADDELIKEVDESIRQARVQDRERTIKQLDQEKFFPAKPGKYDWVSTIGMFGDDEVLKDIAEEALKFREEDREKSRHAASDAESEPS